MVVRRGGRRERERGGACEVPPAAALLERFSRWRCGFRVGDPSRTDAKPSASDAKERVKHTNSTHYSKSAPRVNHPATPARHHLTRLPPPGAGAGSLAVTSRVDVGTV